MSELPFNYLYVFKLQKLDLRSAFKFGINHNYNAIFSANFDNLDRETLKLPAKPSPIIKSQNLSPQQDALSALLFQILTEKHDPTLIQSRGTQGGQHDWK